MKKHFILTFTLCLLAQWSMAQAPKWLEKSKRAVFSIVTYDKNDQILNTGNGFFVTEDGVALSDCSLFKGAERAVIIDCDGKQMAVSAILGANDIYDVIKFRVAITEKKVAALLVASVTPAVGAGAYLLPYATQKELSFVQGTVKEVSKAGDKHHYYTLSMSLKEKMVSCPVITTDGQVFGLAQKSSGKDTTTVCYAAEAAFALSQSISALSLSDRTLRSIGIKKGVPDTEDQALIFLFMASSQVSAEEYLAILEDFIKQYPNNPDGYMRRASATLYTATDGAAFNKVVADFDRALKVSTQKDDVYYNIAKLIYSYQLTKPANDNKEWTYDNALTNLHSASAIDPLPIYTQLEGDILFAKQDYSGALAVYEKVNLTNLVSPTSFFNAAKTKELLGAEPKEILVLLDSCIAHCSKPISTDDAPFLLERAQMNMNAELYRAAMLDYDAYYDAVNGQVNDLFYYYREQASFKARQFQRALDDITKAIELNPTDLTYRAEQAAINLRVGHFDEAVKILQGAIAIDSTYAEAYRLLGVCQIQLKQQAEACASFAKAKELGDTNVNELIQKYCK